MNDTDTLIQAMVEALQNFHVTLQRHRIQPLTWEAKHRFDVETATRFVGLAIEDGGDK